MQQGVDISLQYVDSKFKLERGGGEKGSWSCFVINMDTLKFRALKMKCMHAWKKKSQWLIFVQTVKSSYFESLHFNYEILPKLNIADALNCTNEKVRKGL